MVSENAVIIRKLSHQDKKDIRRISCETAFMGQPSSIFFDDDEILADTLTLYFTDYEPESCFVAEINGQIAGYLIGAKNTDILTKIFLVKIFPRLIIKTILRATIFKKKNAIFIFYLLSSFFKGEFKTPAIFKPYPATLHINIETNFRVKGIGSNLISAYLNYLLQNKVRGVYLSTLSDKAAHFFEKNGFNLLYKSKRSYFRNILHKDIFCYIYGKKLFD